MNHHHTMHSMTTTSSMTMNSGMHHHDNSTTNPGHLGHGSQSGHTTYFYFSDHAVILFAGWVVNTPHGMGLSCLGIFFLAWCYEGLKVFRERLFYEKLQKFSKGEMQPNSTGCGIGRLSGWQIVDHLVQTLLHTIQIVLSYFLMLIFMTYNGYLCIAVVCGSGLGYLSFGWLRKSFQDTSEHCH